MKKRKTLSALVLLFVAVLTGVVVFNTVAKYTTTVNNSGSATVAKWNFATDNEETTYTMNFTSSADATTLVNGKIAPGTSGSFDIELKNSSEVGVNVKVAFGPVTGGTIPAGLKFYRTYNSGTYSNEITPGTTTYTGTMKAKTTSSDETLPTLTVYWVWEYEVGSGETLATNDAADTTAGKAGSTLSIPVTITGTQVEPSLTAISANAWSF